jgi:hypothetical protein
MKTIEFIYLLILIIIALFLTENAIGQEENPDSFLANDNLAETYLKKGENKLACQYFKESVKLNPEYEYGKKMIRELTIK